MTSLRYSEPILIDSNIFINLASSLLSGKRTLESFSRDYFFKKIKELSGEHDLYMPGIVKYELEGFLFGKVPESAYETLLESYVSNFSKRGKCIDIDQNIMKKLIEVNNVLKDPKDRIKFKDKLIIASGLEKLGNSFYILSADYEDFHKKIISSGNSSLVTIEKTIWLLYAEKEDGHIQYKAENIYIFRVNFPLD